MTILVSDLGDTAIGGFKRKVLEYGSLGLLGKGRGWGLDWFVQQKQGFQRRLSNAGVSQHRNSITIFRRDSSIHTDNEARRHGAVDSEDVSESKPAKTIADLLDEDLSEEVMTRRLGFAMQRVAVDMKKQPQKRYTYEEWVEFTRLIRFSNFNRPTDQNLEYDEALDGLIEWDWLDSKSPMTSEQAEPEWVLDRLQESLIRIFRRGITILPQSDRPEQEHYRNDQDNEDMPLWSTRGKVKLHKDKSPDREGMSDTGRGTFRAPSGFHGRMKGVISNTT